MPATCSHPVFIATSVFHVLTFATAETADNNVPSADDVTLVQPSAPEHVTDGTDGQKEMFRKLYLLLTAHVTLFTAIVVLFVYV